MADNMNNEFTNRGEYNQRKGRELHKQDQQQRYGYRGTPPSNNWGEGNFFHTGPSTHGAQDRDRHSNPTGNTNRPASYEQQSTGSHYGNSPGSAYRNERQRINHGDNTGNSFQRSPNYGGSREGNFSDQNDNPNNIHNEGPNSGSRYKEADFRYGSGSHNWYREGRYTADETDNRDSRGFMDRVKDTWNDIWHSDNPDYEPRNTDTRQEFYDRQRRNPQDSSHNFNRGYESGPRWADETDSGNDNYYDNSDRNRR